MLEPRNSLVFNEEMQNMQMREGGGAGGLGGPDGFADDGSLDDLDVYGK